MISREDQEEKGRFLVEEDPLQHNLLSKVHSLDVRLSPGTDNQWSWRSRSHVPWILFTAISISTTRWILVTCHFHFPVILTVWQATTAVLLILLNVYLWKIPSRRKGSNDFANCGHGVPLSFRALLSLCLAASALPVFNQAILHFTNIASLVLFSIHTVSIVELVQTFCSVFQGLASSVGFSQRRSSSAGLTHLVLVALCTLVSHFILTKDYRRSSRGDRSLQVASLLTAFSELFLNNIMSTASRNQKIAPGYYQLFLAVVALISGITWYIAHEGPYTSVQMPSFWLLSMNLISTALAIISGGSLILPLSVAHEPGTQEIDSFPHSLRQRIMSIFSVASIVGLLSLLLPNRGFVNAFQLIAFAITFWMLFISSSSNDKKTSLGGLFRVNYVSRNLTIFAFLCWAAYIPMNFTDFPFITPQPVLQPSLDRNYRTPKRFEIVVAYYDEPLSDTVNMISTITSVPSIENLNPRVVFYTKDEKLNTTEFRKNLVKEFHADPRNKKKFSIMQQPSSHPVMVIEPLWNLGREAGTYLHHIANKWHTLSQHTLFTQATMHDLDLVAERLEYFVPGPAISPLPHKSSGVLSYLRNGSNQGATKLKNLWKNIDLNKLKSFKHKPEETKREVPPSPHDLPEQPSTEQRSSKPSSTKEGISAPAATASKSNRASAKKPAPKHGRSTGMLPLGFETEVCDCHRCSDTWGWYDVSHLIALMFNKVYGKTKSECKNVLLTYKGAFIVSAQRIRGLDRMTYVFYRNGLTLDDRWEHTREYLQKYTGHGGFSGADSKNRWGEKNSLQRPWFGYTMERMWGMLFQCNDMGIAWKCPTFRSGWRSSVSGVNGGADLRDCQCFDHIRPPDE